MQLQQSAKNGIVRRLSFGRVPAVLWVVLALALFFSIFARGFFSASNFLNIAVQSSVLMILALGATVTILTEGIDLSLGSVLSLSGVVAVMMMQRGMPALPAMIIGVGVGLLCGSITGFLISVGKLPPFIATLGMLGLAGGAAIVLTQAGAIYADPPLFVFFGSGKVWFLPTIVIVAAVVYLLVHMILYHTSFGHYIFALGGNEAGASLSGVNTTLWKFMTYVLSGGLAGIAGVLMASRLHAGDPIVGVMWEFDAIAGTILGGTSFELGKGGIGGTLLGVALIAFLRNGLNVIGLETAWQAATIGIVIILAIVLDVTLVRKKEEA
jgi:ribose transport system permease protein